VDPNIASSNRLSEILKRADVLAEEVANIINNLGGEGEQAQALGEPPGLTASASLLKDRIHASASRTRVARKPKPQGKPAASEVELIDPRIASRPDRLISRQEPSILGSDANGSHSADLKSPESTKVEADPGRVGGVQKPLLVSATLMARYNREELYEKVGGSLSGQPPENMAYPMSQSRRYAESSVLLSLAEAMGEEGGQRASRASSSPAGRSSQIRASYRNKPGTYTANNT
jgi:hypothetical protein